MSPCDIVVTGLGVVSSLGASLEEAWSSIEAGRTGLGRLTLFSSPRCGHFPVAEVKGDPATASGLGSGSRNDHLAVAAARAAFSQAGLDDLPAGERARVAVVLGASTGGMLDTETCVHDLLLKGVFEPGLLRHHECASSTEAVARSLGLEGIRHTLSTACSSGSLAVQTGCDVLASKEAEIVLAGGVDSLTRLTLNGFASLLNMDPKGCRPFDANRQGMSLGEGAAVLVLERGELARARNAAILATVAGTACTCDGFHATAPSPDGEGIYRAMSLALERAGLEPRAVDYINAHGTGTLENDLAEARAIERLFSPDLPLVSSTKGYFGHTLAAAGAIEAALCVHCLGIGLVPGNYGLKDKDPEIGFDPVANTRAAEVRAVMSNSLGFGGNNGSLVFIGHGR